MKKIILSVLFCMLFAVNICAAEVSVINNSLSFDPVTDSGEQTYTFVQKDGSVGIINETDGYLNVDIFDSMGRTLKESKKIKITDGKLGGYAYDGTYHYLLFGSDNKDCRGSVTVYKLMKYDVSFNRTGTLILKGDQVYARDIFVSNENHLKLEGNKIFINDVVSEYRYENSYYKNNRSFVVDKNSMLLSFGVGGMTLGYNGGDRNEVLRSMSAIYDNNTYFFAVCSGQGIGLFKVDPEDPENRAEHSVMNISKSNLNAYIPEGILYKPRKGETVDMKGFETTDSGVAAIGTVDNSAVTKLFVSTVPASQYDSMEGTVQYLDEGVEIKNVTVRKISDNDILVMWSNMDTINYCHINKSGNVSTDSGTKKIFGCDLPKKGYTYYAAENGVVWATLYDEREFSVFKLK